MRKFEVGKRYKETDSIEFEIIKRTAKFVTYVEIQHAGRFNERRCEPKEQKFLTGKQEKYSLLVVIRWKHKNIKPGAIPAHYKIA